jgi:hypothetical protein
VEAQVRSYNHCCCITPGIAPPFRCKQLIVANLATAARGSHKVDAFFFHFKSNKYVPVILPLIKVLLGSKRQAGIFMDIYIGHFSQQAVCNIFTFFFKNISRALYCGKQKEQLTIL